MQTGGEVVSRHSYNIREWSVSHTSNPFHARAKQPCVEARSKRDGTRAETRFGLLAKRTSPFKSAGVSVQSAAGSRCVRISGSNAG